MKFNRSLDLLGVMWFCLGFFSANCQQALVLPYLQDANPTSISIHWETDSHTESTVFWGLSPALGNTATGTASTSTGTAQFHSVEITGLLPNTGYYYQTRTNNWLSGIIDLVTPPLPNAEQSFNLLAMSDMQKDGGNPNKFFQLIKEGVLPYVDSVYGNPLSSNLGMVLIPGDLVDNGHNWSQWRNDFFAPASDLFGRVPVYPVPGNHEGNAPQFFSYFKLPLNGTPGYEEHWWYKDYSNVRVLGMDSNNGFRIAAQLTWLDSILNLTCSDTLIDFVFAQLHHPHKSELWLPGEISFTGDVIALMEDFTTNCGKPSIHFFGHTHGYSRGQSRDHEHLWVNVATAGGNIDYWGEYAQADYDEFVISQDEYGFVMVEVTAGNDPQFVLKRISIGDEFVSNPNTTADVITIRKHNHAPEIPLPLFPLSTDTLIPDCIIFKTDDMVDLDGDGHGASNWQISLDSADFENPVYNKWKQHKNWYFDLNTQAGDDLSDEQVSGLEPITTYWWRARHRDRSLGWSDWSTPMRFQTATTPSSGNLIQNPDASNGTNSWTVETGVLESLTAFECNGISPHSGTNYFAIGAICVEHPFASAYQELDVSLWAEEIDSGIATLSFGAYLADFNGSDEPAFAVICYDTDDNLLLASDTTSSTSAAWTLFTETLAVPELTRTVRFIMMGTRHAGTDNDSYLDDIFSRILVGEESPCSEYVAPGPLNGRYYVDLSSPGIPNGESWTKAFHRLEQAIAAADTTPAINEIWIAAGTYRPTTNGDRGKSFHFKKGMRIYGGFAGNETAVDQRDPAMFPVILSGDIGVMTDSTDNSYHVVIASDLADTLVLDGITMRDGMALDAPVQAGAGLLIEASVSGTVAANNCLLIQNVGQGAGAIFNQGKLVLEDCIIVGNSEPQILNGTGAEILQKGNVMIRQ